MAIKYFKLKRKVFSHGVLSDKYIPRIQVENVVGFEEIAEIIENKSTMSRGDILGVLAELETAACYMFETGHPVKLGILGTFFPSIEVISVESPDKITTKLIKRFKIIFKPSMYLRKRLKEVKFYLGDNKVREVMYKKK